MSESRVFTDAEKHRVRQLMSILAQARVAQARVGEPPEMLLSVNGANVITPAVDIAKYVTDQLYHFSPGWVQPTYVCLEDKAAMTWDNVKGDFTFLVPVRSWELPYFSVYRDAYYQYTTQTGHHEIQAMVKGFLVEVPFEVWAFHASAELEAQCRDWTGRPEMGVEFAMLDYEGPNTPKLWMDGAENCYEPFEVLCVDVPPEFPHPIGNPAALRPLRKETLSKKPRRRR